MQRSRESIIQATQAISAIALQIDLVLREAEGPMDRLAQSVARIGTTLADLGPCPSEAAFGDVDVSAAMRIDQALVALLGEYGSAVEDLQCHDRMVQHLSHLRDYLSGIGGLLAVEAGGDEPDTADTGEDVGTQWENLRDQLFRRLITEAQRQFLQMVLPARTHERRITSATLAASHAAPGSIELF